MRKHKEDVAVTVKSYFIRYYTNLPTWPSWIFQDIDEYLCQAKDKSYDTLMHFGRKSLNVAATAAVMAATKVTFLSLQWHTDGEY